jgi:hypothetical protein
LIELRDAAAGAEAAVIGTTRAKPEVGDGLAVE